MYDSNEYTEYEVHYIDKKWGYHVHHTTDYIDAADTLQAVWEDFAKGMSTKTQMRAMGNFYVDKVTTNMYECIDAGYLYPEE